MASTCSAIDLLLDVDTGVDDALAILFALRHPGLRLRAISCVSGNAHVDQVLRNTLQVLEAAGAPDVPVARGAEHALGRRYPGPRGVHGLDGMADLGLPAPVRAPVRTPAVDLLRELLRAADRPVTIAALAPLTNLAVLLRESPDLAGTIAEIVFVGGGFNTEHDPEAARIVRAAGVPVRDYGPDYFPLVTVPPDRIAELATGPDPGIRLTGRLLAHQSARLAADGSAPARIGDAGAVCSLLEPIDKAAALFLATIAG